MQQHEVCLVAEDGIKRGAAIRAPLQFLQRALGFGEQAVALAEFEGAPCGPIEAQHLMQHTGTFNGERDRRDGERGVVLGLWFGRMHCREDNSSWR